MEEIFIYATFSCLGLNSCIINRIVQVNRCSHFTENIVQNHYDNSWLTLFS